jgi:hypothetical protein
MEVPSKHASLKKRNCLVCGVDATTDNTTITKNNNGTMRFKSYCKKDDNILRQHRQRKERRARKERGEREKRGKRGKRTDIWNQRIKGAKNSTKRRATARKQEYKAPTLKSKDLKEMYENQHGECALCACRLVLQTNKSNTISVQRIDPTDLEYSKDKIMLYCYMCNCACGEFSREQVDQLSLQIAISSPPTQKLDPESPEYQRLYQDCINKHKEVRIQDRTEAHSKSKRGLNLSQLIRESRYFDKKITRMEKMQVLAKNYAENGGLDKYFGFPIIFQTMSYDTKTKHYKPLQEKFPQQVSPDRTDSKIQYEEAFEQAMIQAISLFSNYGKNKFTDQETKVWAAQLRKTLRRRLLGIDDDEVVGVEISDAAEEPVVVDK